MTHAGSVIVRVCGHAILASSIYQLGGWLWLGVVYGAIAAAPDWWFIRK